MKLVYRKTFKTTKQNYYSKLVNESDNKSKRIWSIVSDVTNRNPKHSTVPDFKADDMNSFFINNVDDIVNKLPQSNDALKFLSDVTKPKASFDFIHVSVEDTYSAIMKLNNSSSLDGYGSVLRF